MSAPSTLIREGVFSLAVESSSDCIKVLSLEGNLEYMNEGGMCVMEIDDFGRFKGACWPDFWQGEESEKANRALDLAREGGVGRFQGYTATAKGNVRYWDVTVSPIPGPDGVPEKILSVSRDITFQREFEMERERLLAELQEERQKLEVSVEERTQELLRSIQEAEAFNYSISHDLRAPLRAISSTASILLAELGPELQGDHRELLQRQAHNAKRMGELIDDLLHLSRLSRVVLKRERLDLSAMARSVASESDGHCAFEVQDGMVLEGDRSLLRSTLQALMGNARKFSPDGGTIRVGGEGGTFWVKDEGIGFKMDFAKKVFLPFERLVADGEYPGRGIGLANVKRILERHEGCVWCESEPGKGSTFSFSL
ncbi:hypothetical protein EON81_02885 [bacterium]|nr:MAG: hypothetical protein EON81_02885 [bacterium]